MYGTIGGTSTTLRALRESRVSPEPLAVLEEQNGCDRDQHCRSTVLGQWSLQYVRKGAIARAMNANSELAHW
jgi:hypothetical protein